MKFKRLDDNCIRCIVSKEEMDEKGIDINDFIDNRDNAEVFIREILDEADAELDFKTHSDGINVQLSVLPSGDVSLLISDDAQAAINHMLSQFEESIRDIADKIAEESMNEEDSRRTKIDDTRVSKWKPEKFDSKEDTKNSKKETAYDMMDTVIWMEFADLDRVIRLAHVNEELADNLSTLYKYRDTYYLSVPIKAPRKDVARLAFCFGEYCDKMYYETPETMSIIEHGRVLISGNAIEELLKL